MTSETRQPVLRQFFVKSDNIDFGDEFQQIHIINTPQNISGDELMNMIVHQYKLNKMLFGSTYELQLWSGPLGVYRQRLDIMITIPKEFTNVWMRAYIRQN